MSKLLCTCGEIIVDQTDFISNKGYLLADQDYFDLMDEIASQGWNDATSKYFSEVFQCTNCHNIILFKNKHRFDFAPLDKNKNDNVLQSYLGQHWLGMLVASFTNGKGEIFWNTNVESDWKDNLTQDELQKLYYLKFKELTKLKILRHSFLRIDGNMVHQFDQTAS